MNLKEYVKRLNDILNADPKNAKLEVVYSIDSEGNAFHSVYNDPAIGIFEDYDFIDMESAKDPYFEGQYDNKKPNAICIN
jgi:hypothetical protein